MITLGFLYRREMGMLSDEDKTLRAILNQFGKTALEQYNIVTQHDSNLDEQKPKITLEDYYKFLCFEQQVKQLINLAQPLPYDGLRLSSRWEHNNMLTLLEDWSTLDKFYEKLNLLNDNQKRYHEMIAHLATTTITDPFRRSPLCVAIVWGRTKMALDLIEKGANAIGSRRFINGIEVSTELWGNESFAPLRQRYNDHCYDHRYGRQPCDQDYIKTTQSRLCLQDTPLHHAAKFGHIQIAEILVEKGADPNAHMWDGETPLHVAVEGGKTEMVQFLLNAGADPNIRKYCSSIDAEQNALDIARERGHQDIITILEQHKNNAMLSTLKL